jgi:hypothetical protein
MHSTRRASTPAVAFFSANRRALSTIGALLT